MRATIMLLLLMTAWGCAHQAVAESQEHLQAQVPDGWIKGVDKSLTNLQVTEYFPADSPQEWVRKLSYEALQGKPLPDPIEFAASIAEQQSNVCREYSDKVIFSGFENGYPTMVQLYECGENKRTLKPLVTVVKSIKGNAALYVITRIWRLQPSDEAQSATQLMPRDELAGWMQRLKQIQLCDPALPAHKCQPGESQ